MTKWVVSFQMPYKQFSKWRHFLGDMCRKWDDSYLVIFGNIRIVKTVVLGWVEFSFLQSDLSTVSKFQNYGLAIVWWLNFVLEYEITDLEVFQNCLLNEEATSSPIVWYLNLRAFLHCVQLFENLHRFFLDWKIVEIQFPLSLFRIRIAINID